jgi:hypothetical protein
MIILNISKDVESSIAEAVRSGRFLSFDEAIAAAWLAFNQESPAGQALAQSSAEEPAETSQQDKPIWEVADDIRRNIPRDAWAKLPPDGASQHDHYLHGSPKRTAR